MPAWRSERSTILRMTEESSTIRARMLFMNRHSFSQLRILLLSPRPCFVVIGGKPGELQAAKTERAGELGCRTGRSPLGLRRRALLKSRTELRPDLELLSDRNDLRGSFKATADMKVSDVKRVGKGLLCQPRPNSHRPTCASCS